MFEQEVTTKDGITRTVKAPTQELLDEAVKVSKQTEAPVGPDITVPGDNAIVSPDNLPVEPIPSVVDNNAEPEQKVDQPEEEAGEVPVKVEKPKQAKTTKK